ncbi:hypothetical protein BV898_07288 [Hypsibius exemplaris]|uniref:BHLH domain-containing protein n=1 Tax=Hypsibius exemplaris TaxID=2072580 RepID=A0A1W0WTW7_HYPEX|nr:hypothetical protein BV898_07288 [Hypsibius exemplaris]
MHPFSQRQQPAVAPASKPIHKASRRSPTGKSTASDRDDVELLFRKLVQMIPNLPKNRKLTKLEILQAVIDYIQELEERLESHPDAENLCSGLTRLKLSLSQARNVPHHPPENAQ